MNTVFDPYYAKLTLKATMSIDFIFAALNFDIVDIKGKGCLKGKNTIQNMAGR